MRSHSLAIIGLGLLGCGGGGGASTPDAGTPPDASPPAERRLVILYTNDEHSRLFGFGPEVNDYPTRTTPGTGTIVGSIARRATVLAQERAAAQAASIDTLTVSSGDASQGALPQFGFQTTAPDVVLMKKLGYDVMCPGNHEFDLGPVAYANEINAALARGGLPQLVSTNIHFSDSDPGDDSLAALYGEGTSSAPIKRYHVITTPSGIKVGFLGVMGPQSSYYAPLKLPVRFSGDPADEGTDSGPLLPLVYEDIRPTIATLRDVEKVNVVIALAHGGLDLAVPERGDDYMVAKNVSGLDLVVSAHSHTVVPDPIVVDDPDGHPLPVVQAGAFGEYLGRIELIVRPGERPTYDPDPQKTKLIHITDQIVPTFDQIGPTLDAVIDDLEVGQGGQPAFLETALTNIEGHPVMHTPGMRGDLAYADMGTTTFDVIGLRPAVETNVLNLSADANLAAAEEFGGPTLMAVQAYGILRADIYKGATGSLAFADLFRTFPLGFNPVDGSIGYPLSRFYLFTVEIKAAFEFAASLGLENTDFFLVGAGMRVEFDTSRPPQVVVNPSDALDPENGRINRILVDSDHSNGYDDFDDTAIVLFDRTAADPWPGSGFALHPVAASLYAANFASAAGVTLRDSSGAAMALTDTIVHRPDGSDVKDWQAFISYIYNESQANGGLLPSRYDENAAEGAIPRHMICSGPECR